MAFKVILIASSLALGALAMVPSAAADDPYPYAGTWNEVVESAVYGTYEWCPARVFAVTGRGCLVPPTAGNLVLQVKWTYHLLLACNDEHYDEWSLSFESITGDSGSIKVVGRHWDRYHNYSARVDDYHHWMGQGEATVMGTTNAITWEILWPYWRPSNTEWTDFDADVILRIDGSPYYDNTAYFKFSGASLPDDATHGMRGNLEECPEALPSPTVLPGFDVPAVAVWGTRACATYYDPFYEGMGGVCAGIARAYWGSESNPSPGSYWCAGVWGGPDEPPMGSGCIGYLNHPLACWHPDVAEALGSDCGG